MKGSSKTDSAAQGISAAFGIAGFCAKPCSNVKSTVTKVKG